MTREQKRIEREVRDMEQDTSKDVYAQMVNGNQHRWLGRIAGPFGTPYEGGTFYLDIDLPTDYPYNPPKIKFKTKIWHPNISSQTGAICLDILNTEWSPALTIRTTLLSIQALLSSPAPDDPQDAQVATMYKRDQQEFINTAKLWTKLYAIDQPGTLSPKLQRLVEMGFELSAARDALAQAGDDEATAVDRLLA